MVDTPDPAPGPDSIAGPDSIVGQVIDGRYRVRARLARGGMATVYEATDLRLDRVIALKVMHRHLADDPDFVARFQREARAAARLTHPHVVSVYDQGSADGVVYLVMEYVPSRTLRELLRQFGPLSAEQALVILEPVLEGLAAAHAAGFVHRDVKPENVLVSDDGRVKVADFGLARAVSTSNASITQGMIIGTVAYLSPEQVERGDADGRSDVYGAGILLFEMVTGRTPYTGDNPLSVAYQHVNSTVPPPSTVHPGLPPEIDALVSASTQRDPSMRYQSASEFLADVRRARTLLPPPRPLNQTRDTLVVDATTAARMGTSAGADRSSPRTPSAPQSSRYTSPTVLPRRRRRAPLVIALIALAGVVAAALGGWYLTAGRTTPTPDVVGLTADAARAQLQAAGLQVALGPEAFSEDVAAGFVMATDPPAGAGVRIGAPVTLMLSRGPERVSVPDLAERTPAQATEELTGAGLGIGATTRSYDARVPAGQVIGTTPPAGDPVRPGAVIDIVVSKGPRPVDLPDVVGRKAGKAEDTLGSLGLQVEIKSRFADDVPKGEVISMDPPAGTTVPEGSTATLVTSKGPPPVTVPDLIDMPKGKAISALKKLGLVPRVLEGAATPLDRVYSQEPSGGTEVPKGSTVTIRII